MSKKVVKDTEVDLLELILAKLQGATTSVTKATMLKMQSSMNHAAYTFFKGFGQELFLEFSRIKAQDHTIDWLNTGALKLGYRKNKPLTYRWKRHKYVSKNTDKKYLKLTESDIPSNLFKHTGALANELGKLSKDSNLGSYLYKTFGAVTSKPMTYANVMKLPPGWTTSQNGKLFDASGKQQRYEVLLTKELRDRDNYGPISVLPGSGTAPASKAGRFTARPHRGTISTAQAMFEGRLLAGMNFSILTKLSTRALKPTYNGNYLGDILYKGGFIDTPTRIKLGALKRHATEGKTKPAMRHYFLEPFFAKILTSPDAKSLNSRLEQVVKRYRRKR